MVIPRPLDATLARMDYGRALKNELLMEHRPDPAMPYARPLTDTVDLFDELGIGYALIGGIAALHWGRARFTEDVDMVAAAGHEQILAAHPAEMEEHHFDATCTFALYHRSGLRVDIWKDEHTAEIIARAVSVELAGRAVRIIEPHDLIAMKLRGGRLKDDYDIGEIAAANPIDRHQLQRLVTEEQLGRFDQISLRR